MAEQLEIELGPIADLKVVSQVKEVKDIGLVQETTVSFRVAAPIRELARALYAQKRGCPMIASLTALQATLDLRVEEVETATGEIVDRELVR